MKNNIKKIFVLLSMFVCVLSITACNSSDLKLSEDADRNELIASGIILIIILLLIILIISIIIAVRLYHVSNGTTAGRDLAVDNTITQIVQNEDNEMNEKELVAVITAAIVASEGTSTDEFVVRSIKKANKITWQRA